MANLSQIRREQMISFLETLKEQHSDDESLMAINQIEKELKAACEALCKERKRTAKVLTKDITEALIDLNFLDFTRYSSLSMISSNK